MGTHPIFESDFDCLTEKWRALRGLKTHLPDDEYNQVRRILYGKDCKELNLVEAEKMAAENNFEFKAYSMVDNTNQEQNRARNLVKIGLIQNTIHAETTAPVQVQFAAIWARIEKMIDAAAAAGVNVL